MAEYATTYEWRATGTLPPPAGRMGSNNGVWLNASTIILTSANLPGNDFAPYIKQLKPGDRVRIAHPSDITAYCLWTIDFGPIDYGTYFSLPGHALEVQGAPVNLTTYNVTLYTQVIKTRSITGICSSAASTQTGYWFAIYATCDDKSVWTMGQDLEWRRLPDIPQPPPPT